MWNKILLLSVCLIPIDKEFINSDQIRIIREATKSETMGRKGPITTIILDNAVRTYINGTPQQIADLINKERSKDCEFGKK